MVIKVDLERGVSGDLLPVPVEQTGLLPFQEE